MRHPRHPYRLAPGRRLATAADEERHIADLVRLVLLTGAGERLHRPDFGPGLGATALFEPLSDVLPGLVEMRAKGALEQALGEKIIVERVTAQRVGESTLDVQVSYRLRRTAGASTSTTVRVGGT